jgi:hypothetical protein
MNAAAINNPGTVILRNVWETCYATLIENTLGGQLQVSDSISTNKSAETNKPYIPLKKGPVSGLMSKRASVPEEQ